MQNIKISCFCKIWSHFCPDDKTEAVISESAKKFIQPPLSLSTPYDPAYDPRGVYDRAL